MEQTAQSDQLSPKEVTIHRRTDRILVPACRQDRKLVDILAGVFQSATRIPPSGVGKIDPNHQKKGQNPGRQLRELLG